MADSNSSDQDGSLSLSGVPETGQRGGDPDADKLAEMGYSQEMPRGFSVLSILGVGFSLTNSWFGITAALSTGINSGGSALIIYGILLCAMVSTGVGVSLSELASAYPNAGGQYFWTKQLAPLKHARFASYITGWLAWCGAIFTSASVSLAVGGALVGCWQLSHPEFTIQSWHIFVGYEVVNAFCFVFNCYGRTLPRISTISLWTSLVSFFVILVVVPAKAPTHQTAQFVFANFINNTGWTSNGIAFIVGLVNTNWAFACLDCATHMAEEIPRPERAIPIAIMGTVGIGFVTAWLFSIAMFFSVQDLDAILDTLTLVPALELFSQATMSMTVAIILETMVICTGIGCLIASHTWQSRLCWSFARDKGVPFHKQLRKVNSALGIPLPAHFVSCVAVAILGCLYLGSSDALASIITACIVLLYFSYAIPIVYLLVRGRNNIPHGPFWLGRLGFVCNLVTLAWTLFSLVMYSLPNAYPALATDMNYAAAVYAILVVIVTGDWVVRGRKDYGHRNTRKDEVTETTIEVKHDGSKSS